MFSKRLCMINWSPKSMLFPMDTSSSIRNRFDVEIPRKKLAENSSILKNESTWKL